MIRDAVLLAGAWLAPIGLAGCAPAPKAHVAGDGIAFVGSWAPADLELARSALATHVARFRSAWGDPPAFTCEVFPGSLLPSGNPAEAHVSGASRSFRVAAGPDFVLAGATHELHHLAHDPSEAHLDARWPAWDLEDQAAVAAIRARRP